MILEMTTGRPEAGGVAWLALPARGLQSTPIMRRALVMRRYCRQVAPGTVWSQDFRLGAHECALRVLCCYHGRGA